MDALKYQKVIKSIVLCPTHSQFGKFQFIQNLENNNRSFNIDFTFINRLTNSGNLLLNLKDYIKNYFGVLKNYNEVDVVHIVCFFSQIRLLLDLLFVMSFREKIIYDFHGDFLAKFKSSGKFIRWIYLLIIKISSGIICLNRSSYLFLKKRNKHVLQLFNWIEVPDSAVCKSGKKYEIVFHGRITFDKGYRIFEQLARSNPSWKMLLIGPVSSQIEWNLPPNIHHLSPIVDKSVLYGKVLEGRIYLFPSLREGLAFSLIEAMGLGLPVIASNICSNRFLLRHNKQCLIKPEDYDGYQKTLDLLLGNENLMAELGKTNQKFTKLNLSKEKYFDSLYHFYSLCAETEFNRKKHVKNCIHWIEQRF